VARKTRAVNAEQRSQVLPIRSVDLDAGVFVWLHEIVKAKQHSMSPGLKATVQGYEDLVNRAVMAFDAAAGENTETADVKPVPRIKRRERPAPAPEPPVRGRIKRRPR
jgi:hypothetical protein